MSWNLDPEAMIELDPYALGVVRIDDIQTPFTFC